MYKSKVIPYLFILPMLLFLGLFLIYPFTVNIYNSLFKFQHSLDPNPVFYGLKNYVELFKDPTFKASFVNTISLVLLVIVFQTGIALILSLLVHRIKVFQTFYKVSFFMPIIISATALGLMFNMFYRKDGGMFVQLLELVNIEGVVFLDYEKTSKAFIFLSLPVIWQYIGFYFVIFLTGLSTISDELLEAADIDGASSLTKVFRIQIPLLRNITRIVLVLAITGSLKVFDLPYIMNPTGRPNGTLHFLGTYMYQKSNAANIGSAAAFAVMLVVIGFLMSSISNLVFRPNQDL